MVISLAFLAAVWPTYTLSAALKSNDAGASSSGNGCMGCAQLWSGTLGVHEGAALCWALQPGAPKYSTGRFQGPEQR